MRQPSIVTISNFISCLASQSFTQTTPNGQILHKLMALGWHGVATYMWSFSFYIISFIFSPWRDWLQIIRRVEIRSSILAASVSARHEYGCCFFLLSRWEWKQLISLQTIIEYRLERLLEVACVGSLVDWLDAFFAIVRRVWLWFWRERKPDLALKYLCRWTFDFKLIVRPISFLFFVWIMRNMNFSSWTSRSCCDLAHDSTNCVHDNRMRWSKYCVQFQLI